ncbi:MAG TPA: metal-dependent hydrolase [Thermoplasmatales archaeon]|nr:metal-dependent hydrolase [Thermoplasmatales archaeon]
MNIIKECFKFVFEFHQIFIHHINLMIMKSLIFFDNHMHLSKKGRYIEAIRDFKRYGGTHLNFCPYTNIKKIIKNRSYMECYEDGIKIAMEAEKKTGVRIFLTLGPYPVDYLKLREMIGRSEAVNLMKKGMEEAQKLCQEGKAIAIGEIGRPHFPVDEEALNDSNIIMRYGMELAKEVNVPVILHMEGANQKNMREISETAKKVGIDAGRVIKHYSPPIIKKEENFGIFPSVIAKEKNIEEAIKKGLRFMLETDYLDDLSRPGAVLALHTIPKKLKKLLSEEKVREDEIMIINKDNPEKIYGISLE